MECGGEGKGFVWKILLFLICLGIVIWYGERFGFDSDHARLAQFQIGELPGIPGHCCAQDDLADPTAGGLPADAQVLEYTAKGLFGWNGSVPFGDRFYCKKRVLSVLKRKETGHLYGGTERNPLDLADERRHPFLKTLCEKSIRLVDDQPF